MPQGSPPQSPKGSPQGSVTAGTPLRHSGGRRAYRPVAQQTVASRPFALAAPRVHRAWYLDSFVTNPREYGRAQRVEIIVPAFPHVSIILISTTARPMLSGAKPGGALLSVKPRIMKRNMKAGIASAQEPDSSN